MKLDFEAVKNFEIKINFTDDEMPRMERISGCTDSGELLKLYWYAKGSSDYRTYSEYIPLFIIKSVEIRSIE
jgi:hypothetical protein